ncbi:peptidoglycan-binding protein [Rhizobium sp. KVB221]|uniref:Peptidoglycan-binding protein n=1 Tax=Rhizobium setariae TaxID=2801340 RepID=A0A937CRC8_9HYPH|nr:peptidoglycan-binding protein [Rhizobium setariae]
MAQERVPYSVVEIQKALNQAGFGSGNPDSVWGKKSAAALKAFQRARGLDASGRMDAATMAKLFPIQEAIRRKVEAARDTDGVTP